ncbi:unnamed protein product, partial [Closterium sp. NIES-64]
DLSTNQLSGPIPKEIGSMTALNKLDFSYNQLESIPSTLSGLSILSHMYLSYNELSGPIPDTIGSLTSLTTLGLRSNKLSGAIPPSIALLKNINVL